MADGETDNFVNNLVSNGLKCLSCSCACLHLKQLPCTHIFCQKCLQDVAGSSSSFLCPCCHSLVLLPPGKVEALQPVLEVDQTDGKPKLSYISGLSSFFSQGLDTRLPLTSSRNQKRLIIFLAFLVLVIFLALCVCLAEFVGKAGKEKYHGLACDNKVFDCQTTISTEIMRTSQLLYDVPALKTRCHMLRDRITACVREVKASCLPVQSVNVAMHSWQAVHDSMCGPEMFCHLEVMTCFPSKSAVDEISRVSRQNPPNVKLLNEKCRALNGTVGQCVGDVTGTCSNVSSISPKLSAIQSSLNSLCGHEMICHLEVMTCFPSKSAVDEISRVSRQNPTNVKLLTEKCRALNGTVGQCVGDVTGTCSNVSSISPKLSAIQSSLNSLCGHALMCKYQVQTCIPSSAALAEISNAARQSPPYVQMVAEKCRALTATVTPCVDSVKKACSSVSSVISPTISSVDLTMNSVCGTLAQCRLKMIVCHSFFKDVNFVQGITRHNLLCRIKAPAMKCLGSDLGAQCRSLPEIKPVVDNLESIFQSVQCSDGKRVVGSSILVLLLAVFTAWTTHP
ncbi:hypothetical protein ACOMHN_029067 [Nucella lapillus]